MHSTRRSDPAKLDAFLGKVVGDLGSALSAALAYVGQELGLYRALATGWSTPGELAERTGTRERYVREWLLNQAAGGYCEYDGSTGRYSLSPEQAEALADESSPPFTGGGFYVAKALMHAAARIRDDFRIGAGMRWGEHDPDLFLGTERFFRPGYQAHLIASWIPALDGVRARLEVGKITGLRLYFAGK